MKRSVSFGLLVWAFAALLAAGCATSPSGAWYDSSKPQTLLPNANLQQARGLAKGSAISKGWKVVQAADDLLVLQRPLNASTAQSVSSNEASGSLPSLVEIRSSFFERDGGVVVVLDAQVISGQGTKKERREDFTESYRPELEQSLASLRQAWQESGWRVATATPPLAQPGSASEDAMDEEAELASGELADDSATPSVEPATVPSPAVVGSAWGSASAPPPVATGAVPVEDRSPPPAPATSPVAPANAGPTVQPGPAAAQSNPSSPQNMLALNPPSESGVWAYYAEHYARIRGCTLNDQGSELVEKASYSETHRVHCEDGKTFLVRCNAGVCRGLR